MVCQAPQLGENEALGAEICAGLWGIDKIAVYTDCFEEAIYDLIDITFALTGKNTNSIFEAAFRLNFIYPREPATESLAGFRLPYPGA
jgi:hypothetical protein